MLGLTFGPVLTEGPGRGNVVYANAVPAAIKESRARVDKLKAPNFIITFSPPF